MLTEEDAKLVAKVLRYLNENTSSSDASELAWACGWERSKFPEMFRRLTAVADVLHDE